MIYGYLWYVTGDGLWHWLYHSVSKAGHVSPRAAGSVIFKAGTHGCADG